MKYEIPAVLFLISVACAGEDPSEEVWTDEALKAGADSTGSQGITDSIGADPGEFGADPKGFGADPPPDTAIPYKCVESLGSSWCTCRADVEGDCTGMSTFCRNNGGDGIVTCQVYACTCSYVAPPPDPEPDPK